jgi:hypothetical protein
VSCYFRHIRDLLIEAGMDITPANKKQVDAAVHDFVKVNYKDCPAAWRRLKSEILDDDKKRLQLIDHIRASIST